MASSSVALVRRALWAYVQKSHRAHTLHTDDAEAAQDPPGGAAPPALEAIRSTRPHSSARGKGEWSVAAVLQRVIHKNRTQTQK